MLVSIDRRQLTKKTKEPSVSKKRGSGVRGKKKKQYHHGGDMKEGEKPMVVRLERRKITGPLGMKPAPLTHSDSFTMMMNTPDPLTTSETHTHTLHLSLYYILSSQLNQEEQLRRKRNVILIMEVYIPHPP